jgi:hypothetical protein
VAPSRHSVVLPSPSCSPLRYRVLAQALLVALAADPDPAMAMVVRWILVMVMVMVRVHALRQCVGNTSLLVGPCWEGNGQAKRRTERRRRRRRRTAEGCPDGLWTWRCE